MPGTTEGRDRKLQTQLGVKKYVTVGKGSIYNDTGNSNNTH